MDRSDYHRSELRREELAESPISQLEAWLAEAVAAEVPEPMAMCVATATWNGVPSNRFVLLRGLDERGLTFYTNYGSRKAEEIEENPHAAATFWWPSLERQIRVEGDVERVSPEESDAYFASRPIKSRLASTVSPQSQEIPDRKVLEEAMDRLAAEQPEGPPRPEHWGGYRIVPQRVEFWQGRRARLHDRFRYSRMDEGWAIVRLAP